MALRATLFLPLVLAASLSASCSPLTSEATDPFDTSSLARTYSGVLQVTGGASKIYVSLDQTVTVTQPNPLELSFSSSAFPTFTAPIVSSGGSAVDLVPVGYSAGTGVEVQEVAFAKDMSGNTVLVIQTVSGIMDAGTNTMLVQFASYDPASAPPATADLAVEYLDQIFELATGSSK